MNRAESGEEYGNRKAAGWLVVVVIGILALVQLIGARPAAAVPNASPFVTVYTIPTAGSEPTHIIALGPGNLWFTMTAANAIGHLSVQTNGQYAFNQYPIPTAGSAPYDLAYDGQYIWFTERQGNKIGRLHPGTGAFTEYPIPTANSEPMGILVTSSGTVWFAERMGNKIGRLNPGTGAFTEYPYPVPNVHPTDITGRDDNLWFTAPGRNIVVQFFPDKAPSQQFEVVPVLDFGLQPWPPGSIAVLDQPNDPWITAPSKDFVGRYAPGTLNYWRWIQLIHEGTEVTGLFLQRVSNRYFTWFTEPAGGRAGFIVTASEGPLLVLYEQPLPGNNPRPTGITVDANGTAWITAPGTNAIISWGAPYFYRDYVPAAAAP